MNMGMLEIQNCVKSFGGLIAVKDLTMSLNKGDLYGLIGPNGAGKTTVFNLITGVYRPDEGMILLEGREIHGMKPSSTAKLGKIGRGPCGERGRISGVAVSL